MPIFVEKNLKKNISNGKINLICWNYTSLDSKFIFECIMIFVYLVVYNKYYTVSCIDLSKLWIEISDLLSSLSSSFILVNSYINLVYGLLWKQLSNARVPTADSIIKSFVL